jgi:hypothetical protein
MNRAVIATTVLSLSTPAYACFDGTAYGYNFSDGLQFLYYSFFGLILAIALRVLRGSFRLYLPIGVALASAYLPARELWWWGNGDCGIGFVGATQNCAGVISLLLLYELVLLYRQKRNQARTRDA